MNTERCDITVNVVNEPDNYLGDGRKVITYVGSVTCSECPLSFESKTTKVGKVPEYLPDGTHVEDAFRAALIDRLGLMCGKNLQIGENMAAPAIV